MADRVIAEKSAVVASRNAKGRRSRTRIIQGKMYRSDDPVVQGREHLFRPVEDATSEPGAKRSIRRTRKPAEAAAEAPTPAPKPTPAAKKAAPAAPKAEGE